MATAIIVQIIAAIWLDLLLSGDNAVVIALAVRALPKHQQNTGMVLGVGTAIIFRLAGMALAAFLMSVPGLRIVGAAFLCYVAYGMVKGGDDDTDDSGGKVMSLLSVAVMIGFADATMSLDNIVAIAALAHGNPLIMGVGVILSIPFVVLGAALIKSIVDRWPVMVWAAAAFLIYIAFGIATEDCVWALMKGLPTWINSDTLTSAVLAIELAIFGAFAWSGHKQLRNS
jgi:YjbE family integral membrane protein